MELKLPLTVISQVDVARMMRELNALNDFMVGAAVRKTGQPMQLPRLTHILDDVAKQNGLNLINEPDRKRLYANLNQVMGKSPLMHVSFASEPSAKALEQILTWLRTNIHPQALLQVGLQPTIAAGCVLRTPNLLFDLSMRAYLKQQEGFLAQLITKADTDIEKKPTPPGLTPAAQPKEAQPAAQGVANG